MIFGAEKQKSSATSMGGCEMPLEDLVPPLELCKQIKGSLWNTALVWERNIVPIDGREFKPHVVEREKAITTRILAPPRRWRRSCLLLISWMKGIYRHVLSSE